MENDSIMLRIALILVLGMVGTAGAQTDGMCMDCKYDKAGNYECARDPDCWDSSECLIAMTHPDKDGCPDACSSDGPKCLWSKKFSRQEYVGTIKRGQKLPGDLSPCDADECVHYRLISTWKAPTKKEVWRRSQRKGSGR